MGHRVTDNQAYNILFYFIALLVVAAVIVITYRLDDSKVGRAWTAIREDELSAGAMGINANKLKLGAFAVGASFAGAMGVLFAASRTFVSPETFTFLQSVGVLTMVILGGIGSITGVIVGATVVTLLNIQVLQSFSLYLSPAAAERRGDPAHRLPLEEPLQPAGPVQVPAPDLRDDPGGHDDLPARRPPSGRAAQAGTGRGRRKEPSDA